MAVHSLSRLLMLYGMKDKDEQSIDDHQDERLE